jgi:hypothetical protein
MIRPIHGKFGLDSSGRMRNAEVRFLPPQPRSRLITHRKALLGRASV